MDGTGDNLQPPAGPLLRYVPLAIAVIATSVVLAGFLIALRNDGLDCGAAQHALDLLIGGTLFSLFVALPCSLWALVERRVDRPIALLGLALSLSPIALWLLFYLLEGNGDRLNCYNA
jgi:hypothetical protein